MTGVAATVALFFPATSAEAAKTWMDEIKAQAKGFEKAMQEARADAVNTAQNRLTDALLEFMTTGNMHLKLNDVGFKANLVHVECSLSDLAPNVPAEGYTQIAIGWKF